MTTARRSVQMETAYCDIEIRTDAAILALPGPVRGSMYAEFWPLPYDGNALSAARTAEKAKLLERLRWRDGDCCYYCFDEVWGDEVTVDHWIPRAAQGSEHLVNLRLACRRCNASKKQQVPTVNVHTHHWPERNGPVRCFRCLTIRPARRRPLPEEALRPRTAPRPAPPPLRPAPPIVRVQPPTTREEHLAQIDAKIERLRRAARSLSCAPATRQRLAALERHREAMVSGAPQQTPVKRPANETKSMVRAYWRQAQASWLDDGGALHLDRDDDR